MFGTYIWIRGKHDKFDRYKLVRKLFIEISGDLSGPVTWNLEVGDLSPGEVVRLQ